ncbi:hypothetical protein ACN47E_001413 [Coniothyrium glycines]
MATSSTEFLVVDEYERQPRHYRTRSRDYVDRLEEEERMERRDRERQMKRYHDGKYPSSSSSHHRSTSDRLCVPVFETPVRKVRSDETPDRSRESSPRTYNVQERRPGPAPAYDYDLTSEPILPSQLLVRQDHKPRHQKKPSIKVQIHQDNPPSSASHRGTTPSRSPNASPRSPTARPQLQYQYETLQNKLSQVVSSCAPYLKVEAANPRDLTFSKIADQVEGFAFELRLWAYTSHLEGLARVDVEKRRVVEIASRNLDRLASRVSELADACLQARPKDLKMPALPEVEDDDNLFGTEANSQRIEDPTESLGFIIQSSLHSIELQLQGLKRLSRSLQEATPDAKDEVVAVSKLVEEVAKYFGSQEALDKYSIDEKFAGGKALEEARYASTH